MPDDVDLLQIERGSVTAPAGCGKTHLIGDALRRHQGRKPMLVLTHTNAGVAALRGRLTAAGVPARAYRLATIDGWSMRLISTFPGRSGHDPEILQLRNPRTDYPQIRRSAALLLKAGHVQDVVAASYSRILVDEYQDCSTVQHAIVHFASHGVPICVLGDPMQAIFGFAGNTLVDWEENVQAQFPAAGELTTPWRWKNVGEEDFGQWLLDTRRKLLAGEPIDLRQAVPNVTWVELDGSEDHQRRLRACRTAPPNQGGNVLIIGESTSPQAQRQFASQTPNAIAVESVDLKDLVNFAQTLNLDSAGALGQVVTFAGDVMTNVGANDLLQRVTSLRAGLARNPATEIEQAAMQFAAAPSLAGVRKLLADIGQQGGVHNHRPAILRGCIKALQLAEAPGGPGFYDAAVAVREQSRALGRPLPRRAVGSTLLLKGLEADVSVLLNVAGIDRQNLYVAMTRGSRRLLVCSPTPVLHPG